MIRINLLPHREEMSPEGQAMLARHNLVMIS